MDRIRTRALGDPSDPKARMVPLYHGGELIKDDLSKKSYNTPSKSNDHLRLRLYSPPSRVAIWGQR
ncbi:hypothetical protein E2C01_096378 [Portunus trituberculatus]|uniref:Uncharacterized protein n=1 Tax=Portunus trituberculatus TaxID=210409 RepID=A0A5B7K2M3_PORTR|nr:hypothetical protein [Portunus trituberculatus]